MDFLRSAAALAALALALAGCGESREEQRVKELRGICQSSAGKTIQEIENAYGVPIRLAECDSASIVGTLGCPADQALCIMGFWFTPSTDPGVCESTGCAFWCEIRAQLADLKAHEELDDHRAIACGVEWVDGQPSPGVFYFYDYWQPGQLP